MSSNLSNWADEEKERSSRLLKKFSVVFKRMASLEAAYDEAKAELSPTPIELPDFFLLYEELAGKIEKQINFNYLGAADKKTYTKLIRMIYGCLKKNPEKLRAISEQISKKLSESYQAAIDFIKGKLLLNPTNPSYLQSNYHVCMSVNVGRGIAWLLINDSDFFVMEHYIRCANGDIELKIDDIIDAFGISLTSFHHEYAYGCFSAASSVLKNSFGWRDFTRIGL